MRHIFFFFLYAVILRLLAGCAPMYGGQYGYAPSYPYAAKYGSARMFARSQAYAMPAPPSNIGFMYREPVGWTEENPRSFRLKNTTDDLHGRCWLDGREVLPTAWGQIPRAAIATQTGVAMAPMLPPQAETYFIVSVGKHHLKCQLYSGPAPFQLTHTTDIVFQTNGVGGRTFHLHPDYMRSARGLPAN